MTRFGAVTIGAAVALFATSATPAIAQAERSVEAQHVTGKVQMVDPTGTIVKLSDGTTLIIPDNVKVNRDELKPGAMVEAAFEDRAGARVVTSLRVRPGRP